MDSLVRSIAASETQLTRLLFAPKSSSQASRLPSRHDPSVFKVDEDLAVINAGPVHPMPSFLRITAVLELDESVALGETCDDVPDDCGADNGSK